MKQIKKSVCMILALLLCVVLLPFGAAKAQDVPQTKEEILELYRAAVNGVRAGAAGYAKKTWQTVPGIELFNNATANNAIKDIVGKYITTQENAPEEYYASGTDDAREHFPACTLTDLSKISSASCTMEDGGYHIHLTLAEEASPATGDSSFLGQITDNLLHKDEVDRELADISVLNNIDYDLTYDTVTVDALITPDGQFVSLLHHTSVLVDIHTATLLSIFKLKDKSMVFTMDESFYNFQYDGAAPAYMPGDVSGDGNVTAADARLALRTAVGLEDYAPGSREFLAADVDENKVITAADARMILRAAVGLETLSGDGTLTKEEIAAKLTAAVNKTKAYTGDVTVEHTEEFSSMNITKCPGGSVGINLANRIASGVLKPTTETLRFSGGVAVNSDGEQVPLLLPESGDFSLPAAGIQTASAEERDGKLYMEVTLVEEKVSRREVPPYNAGAIGYLKAGDLDLSLLTIERVDVTYTGSTIVAVINENGMVERIAYTIPVEIDAAGRALGISGEFACDGMQTEIWNVNW